MRTDSEDFRRARMLVEVLPEIAGEGCFALKGGTAINMFLLDLPRLSVDVDLTYLPISDYAIACEEIDASLRRIRNRLIGGSPPFAVTMGLGSASGHIDTLRVERDGLDIKIEVNPVLRGTLHPPAMLPIRAAAENHLGFARMAVLAYDDLYAGKLVAALDRQHPRDLFDIKLLLEGGGIPDSLFRAFLVYLVGHKGVIAQTLDPRRKDISTLYRDQLVDMLAQPVSLDDLVETRERMISAIHARLGEREKRFLLSVKRMEPDWELLDLPAAASLPAVRWKLHNLAQMSANKRKAALEKLERILNRIGG